MQLKSIGFALVVLLLTGGVAWAGKEAYQIVLSQDKALCSTMLKLLNEDIKKYGDILYEEHEMFTAITWQPLSAVLGEKFADDPYGCSTNRLADIDLNNDGRMDTVVKSSGCFRDRIQDSLFILNVERDVLVTYDYDDISKNSIGQFPAGDEPPLATYEIRTPLRDKQGNALSESLWGWFVIEPFLYKSTAYLAVTDRGADGDRPYSEVFVIGKYKNPRELDEVCLFKQPPLKKKP